MIERHRPFGEGQGADDADRLPHRRPARAQVRAAPRSSPRLGGLRSSDVAVIAIGVGLVLGLIIRFAIHLG